MSDLLVTSFLFCLYSLVSISIYLKEYKLDKQTHLFRVSLKPQPIDVELFIKGTRLVVIRMRIPLMINWMVLSQHRILSGWMDDTNFINTKIILCLGPGDKVQNNSRIF